MNNCAICDTNLSFFNRRKLANNKAICEDCLKKAKTLSPKQLMRLKNVTVDEILQSIKESVGGIEYNFTPTKEIGETVKFDDNNKQMLIATLFESHVIDYDEIISFELLEDNESVASGGVGRAIVGGILFGGAGAVVGAVTANKKKNYCNSLGVKITVNNTDQPNLYVPLIHKKTKTNSDVFKGAYNQAQEILSTLEVICNR